MKSRIWHMTGVGLVCLSVGTHVLAEDHREDHRDDDRPHGGEHGREWHDGNQGHPGQGRPEGGPHMEHNGPHQGGQMQGGHQPEMEHRLPIQGRPDTVWRREPEHGREQWHGGAPEGWRREGERPHDERWERRWEGRPSGHGNGWGEGAQFRPGYMVDRFPDRHWRVPYRGMDYFFSGGYWYRSQGPRYMVVTPPHGIRVSYLPDFAREVWVGGSLFFLAAGAYYMYEPQTQDYVVVNPPVADAAPVSNGYDVVAYPANGQSPEQIDQDRYDCYRWAVQQSGFDPRAGGYAPAPAVVQTYRQAEGNCLSSRGYQVNY